jgi:hypothetical protein
MRSSALFVSVFCALALAACGGASDPAGENLLPPLPPNASENANSKASDLTIQPATVEEARKMCEAPPTEWEDGDALESDYYGFRWVMCKPSLVITAPTRSDCTGNESMDGCGLPTIAGFPHRTWAFNIQVPNPKTMFASFPLDDGLDTGLALGRIQQGRGGLVHWLRLPVDPELVAKVGTSSAIFVRIKNCDGQHPVSL